MMDCSIDNPTACPETNKAGEYCYIDSDNLWRCLPKSTELTKAMAICHRHEDEDKVWDEVWKACRRVWGEYQKTEMAKQVLETKGRIEKDRERVNDFVKGLGEE